MRVEKINGDYNEIREIPREEAIDDYCQCCLEDLPETVTRVKQFSDFPHPIRWEFCGERCWRKFKEGYYAQPEVSTPADARVQEKMI